MARCLDIADARLLLELRDEARAAVVAGDPCRIAATGLIECLRRDAGPGAGAPGRLLQHRHERSDAVCLAADRGNPSLARLQDALHPAVLGTIKSVVAGADGPGYRWRVRRAGGDPAGALVLWVWA